MNEQIEQLESQLDEMEKSKRIAIYITIIISLVYTSWNIFGEDMSLEIETKESNIVSLMQKLQKNSIKSIEGAIKKAQRESLALEEDVTNLHFKNQFLRGKLESIGFIYYNQQGMATILDDTLKSTLKNKIDVSLIESHSKHQKFAPYIFNKKQIDIKGSGSFKGIMSLIQYIDSFNALLKIDSITVDIDKDQKTTFELDISSYGVEL